MIAIDPQDLIFGYGRAGTKGYVLEHRRTHQVVFTSDSKTEVISEAQRLKGWEPVDGSEVTYGYQIAQHNGEAR